MRPMRRLRLRARTPSTDLPVEHDCGYRRSMTISRSRRDATRRDLLRGGLAAAALGLVHSACGGSGPAAATSPKEPAPAPPAAPKRILILGGTGFLGPKTVDAA